MNWYIAKLVFSINTEAKTCNNQFDENLRLITADSKEEAVLKARVLGLKEEDRFLNNNKQVVKWDFVNVLDVQLIAGPYDGVELSSKIFEEEKTEDYIHYVHLRAAHLQTT